MNVSLMSHAAKAMQPSGFMDSPKPRSGHRGDPADFEGSIRALFRER